MRSLSQALLRGQRARTILAKNLLLRCVLTYGSNEYEYTKTRIKRLAHTEQKFSHKSELMLDDTDKTLHGLDLEGYKAVLGYGLITRAGEEWVDTAPMWVIGQQRDSYQDRLECSLSLEGIFDRMGKHKAHATYTQESDDTNTIKDLLTEIAGATLAPYTGYPAYTITFDSEDDLIDSFIPADGFRVNLNESRLSKWNELMGYTNCVSRIGSDEAIHILNPTTSGTTYDNEYSLAQGQDYHKFFSKRFRRRIVSPNHVTFMTHPSYSKLEAENYTGYAKDDSADLTDMLERETHYVRATSNAQCFDLAEAYLSKKQMDAEKGWATIPFVHFGQEIHDYTNIVDARAGDNRAGNIGFLTRFYQPGQFNMNFGFGKFSIATAMQALAQAGVDPTDFLLQLQDWIIQILDYIETLPTFADVIGLINENTLNWYMDAYFVSLTVTERLRIPHGPNKYGQYP